MLLKTCIVLVAISVTIIGYPNVDADPDCPIGFTLCYQSHRCIAPEQVCDGYPDCVYGEEEFLDGTVCCQYGFVCSSGTRCLPKHRYCDGTSDCADGSDEKPGCKPGHTTVWP